MEYFTMEELTHSEVADKMKISNEPSSVYKNRLGRLVEEVLDPLRRRYGKPIYVNSGYRSLTVNEAVGGAPNSQHCIGEAADIRGHTMEDTRRIWRILITEFSFDQAILYHKGRWIHVSYTDRRENRNEILYITRVQ